MGAKKIIRSEEKVNINIFCQLLFHPILTVTVCVYVYERVREGGRKKDGI